MKTNTTKLLPEEMMTPVSKLPNIIRTRFCSFAIKKLLNSFLRMSLERQDISHKLKKDQMEIEEVLREESYSQDEIGGIYSYISGRRLNNYEEALLLSYGGIYHNKEKSDNLTANLQIYRKLTKEELKLDENLTENYLEGFNNLPADDIPSHGFSGAHVRNCGIFLKKDLESRGIKITDLYQKAAINLNKITFEEMATFKSSLESSHLCGEVTDEYPDLTYGPAAFKEKKYQFGKTIRALEGILEVLKVVHTDENVKPFHLIATLMNECNKRGGIVTILFKKAQFGSTREIFILTMFARIVVRFVESIARTVAEALPNEYLTKGTKKLNSTPTHYIKVKNMRASGDSILHVFDSLDCTTWCQNFTFPVFGNLFSVIFSEWPEASEVIREVFNMASSKRHEMTDVLMSIFENQPTVNSMEESMNVLKSEFLGSEEGKLNKGNKSIFVKNVSNFMQGIFHYTSTVMHSSHLLVMSEVMKKFMLSERLGVKAIVHTTKASSDDSSSLFSVVYKTNSVRDRLKIRVMALTCSEILVGSYPFMCAKIGDAKSTKFVENGVEEFNSSWCFRNTVLSIPSKFTSAAVCPKITRSTVERQRVDHNLLNSCIENGSSHKLAKIVEICCALNHYCIIGLQSLSSIIWDDLSQAIITLTNPSTHLYINSPPIIGTTLGFEVTEHVHLKNNLMARKVQYALEKKFAGSYDLVSGYLIQSSIVVGKLDKYKNFLERVCTKEEFEDAKNLVEKEPVLLYRDPSSVEEVKAKIILKARTSGAERSFIFEDESSIHAISAYLSTSPSLTVSVKENDSTWQRRKMTLPCFLKKVLQLTGENEYISEVENHTKTILEMVEQYNLKHLVYIGRRRKIPVKVRFPKIRSTCEIPLIMAAKHEWFGISNGFTTDENREAFIEYQTKFDWLKATHQESVKEIEEKGIEGNSVFVLNVLLINETDKDKTVSFLHSGRRDSTMVSSYLRCLEYNYQRDYKLKRPEEMYATTEMGDFLRVEEELHPHVVFEPTLKLILGIKEESAEDACKKIIEKNSKLFLSDRSKKDIRFFPNRLKNLLSIGTCYLSKDKHKLREALLTSPGYIISYLKEQRRVVEEGVTKWVGEGEFFVETKSANFIIKVDNGKLLQIKSSKPQHVTENLDILRKILRSLKVDSDADEPVKSGVKILDKKLLYTTNKGSPVVSMTFFENRKEQTIETDLVVANSNLELIVTTNLDGTDCKSDSIKFRPELINANKYSNVFSATEASQIIVASTDYCEDKGFTEFVSNSLQDRIAKKGYAKSRKYRKVYDSQIVESDYDEDLTGFEEQLESLWTVDLGTHYDEEIDEIAEVLEDEKENSESEDDEDFFAEQLIDDDLAVVVMTNDSRSTNYEDLTIWDSFINGFTSLTNYSLQKLVEGKYTKPEDGTVQRDIIEALIQLNVIKEPENDLNDSENYEAGVQKWKNILKQARSP